MTVDRTTDQDAAPRTAALPAREPAVDTTRRQDSGPATHGPLKASDREGAPKLPHERDESVDMTHGKPDVQIEQAYRDVQRGLQDTDRGPPADKAYQKQK